MRRALAALLVSLAAVAAPVAARADARAADLEALMAEYTRLWSAKDAHAIATRIYRLDPGAGPQDEAALAEGFRRLVAEGYDRSELQSVEACKLTGSRALAVLRFTRLRADGTPMPPKDRASLYLLRRFDDGWRITALLPMSPTASLSCTSAAE
jgi:hypothetical protein